MPVGNKKSRSKMKKEYQHLYEKLTEYAASDYYPYHMPGHKRRTFGDLPGELFSMDITEIDGFDDLHHPEEILEHLQKQAAALYGAEESFYLVNGSTCGVLAAISAALNPQESILMARNCHKSAYHAAYLRGLDIHYLWPEQVEGFPICEAITPEQVSDALEQTKDIRAVLIVSPTYEGRIADVKEIARLVHEKGIPLIVDEAHGAHLGLDDTMPENSCRNGADLVIHSVHKTLPSLTQTALLHVNGSLVDREKLRRFLRIYQSSSPSYVLMAGIDNALQMVEQNGKQMFEIFQQRFRKMMRDLEACKHLKFLPYEPGKQDVGKLVISTHKSNITGRQLYDILLKQYHLQLELAAENDCLAMFTVGDTEEGYERMTKALLEIDASLESVQRAENNDEKTIVPEAKCAEDVIPLRKAWDAPQEILPLTQAIGRYVGDFIQVYPPGVPILVPGEKMTREKYDMIVTYIEKQLNVQGLERMDREPGMKVLMDS